MGDVLPNWRSDFMVSVRVYQQPDTDHGTPACERNNSQHGKNKKPLLHLILGGEVKDLLGFDFKDANALDIVGIFPNYASALEARRGASHRHVDNSAMKYAVVHLHRLLKPEDPV